MLLLISLNIHLVEPLTSARWIVCHVSARTVSFCLGFNKWSWALRKRFIVFINKKVKEHLLLILEEMEVFFIIVI